MTEEPRYWWIMAGEVYDTFEEVMFKKAEALRRYPGYELALKIYKVKEVDDEA